MAAQTALTKLSASQTYGTTVRESPGGMKKQGEKSGQRALCAYITVLKTNLVMETD